MPVHPAGGAGLAHQHRVEPAAAALAPGHGAELAPPLAQPLAGRVGQLRRERPLAHPRGVGLDDAEHEVDRPRPHAGAGRRHARQRVRRGHVRIGAEVDVEQRPLRPLEQDAAGPRAASRPAPARPAPHRAAPAAPPPAAAPSAPPGRSAPPRARAAARRGAPAAGRAGSRASPRRRGRPPGRCAARPCPRRPARCRARWCRSSPPPPPPRGCGRGPGAAAGSAACSRRSSGSRARSPPPAPAASRSRRAAPRDRAPRRCR